MTEIFNPGQTVYLLFWRRPADSVFGRVQFFRSKRRRDNGNIDLLTWGLITLTAEWVIPLPFTSALKDVKLEPTCPKCGAALENLDKGEGDSQWVCPDNCDSSLEEVLKKANKLARQELGDDGCR